MKNLLCMALCCTVLARVALAEDVPAVAARLDSRVLELVPADPQVVLYTRDLSSVLGNPALSVAAGRHGPALADTAAAWKDIFGGPSFIAIRANALRPDAVGISFGAAFEGNAGQLLEGLESRLAPALSQWGAGPLIQIGRDGDLVTVRPAPLPVLTLYLGVRDGLVFGDTRRSMVTEFVSGAGEDQTSFVATDEFKRLPGAKDLRAGRCDLLAYLNLRLLVPMVKAQMDGPLPGAFDALGLGDFESAALTAYWSGQRISMSVGLGVAEETGRLATLLAPASGKLEVVSRLPADYLFVLAGAMTSASDAVDRVCEIVRMIDPEIVEEYRQELAQVTDEFGFDPQHDFLGNMVEQWAVGLKVGEDQTPQGVLMVKLADPELFVSHLRNLVTGYHLPVDTTVYHGVEVVTRADQGYPRLSLAVVDDYLVAAGSTETLAEIVDARGKEGAPQHVPAIEELAGALPPPRARMGYLNLAQFARLALAEEGFDSNDPAAAAFQSLARTDARMGLAITRRPKMISLEVALSEAATTKAANLLTQSLAASMDQARYQSQRAVSLANIKGILTSCMIHAQEHEGQFPASLGELVADGTVTLDILRSPYDGTGPTVIQEADELSFYLYRMDVNINELDEPSSVIVVAEREVVRGQGAGFGFGDGHAEWIAEPEASRLLAELRQNTE